MRIRYDIGTFLSTAVALMMTSALLLASLQGPKAGTVLPFWGPTDAATLQGSSAAGLYFPALSLSSNEHRHLLSEYLWSDFLCNMGERAFPVYNTNSTEMYRLAFSTPWAQMLWVARIRLSSGEPELLFRRFECGDLVQSVHVDLTPRQVDRFRLLLDYSRYWTAPRLDPGLKFDTSSWLMEGFRDTLYLARNSFSERLPRIAPVFAWLHTVVSAADTQEWGLSRKCEHPWLDPECHITNR